MKRIEYNEEKNKQLKTERNVSFEDVIEALGKQKLLDDIKHSGVRKHQRIFIVEIDRYAYAVPYVEDEEKIFLKTIFPSRKYTKQYLKKT